MGKEALEGLLKFLLETLQQGKDFTMEQAPIFVKELLMWRAAEDIFFIVMWLTLLTIAIVVGVRTVNCTDDSSLDAIDKKGFKTWIIGIGLCFMVAAIAINGYDLVKVKVAPRVVLVEMVRDLINPTK